MPHLFLWTSFILTLAGFFSQFGLWFDLAAHFRWQYLLLQLFCIILCLVQKRRKLLTLTIIFAFINACLILGYYFPKSDASDSPYGQPIKLVSMNINFANTDADAVIKYIERTSPDIFILEEINTRWLNDLKPAFVNYPYFKEIPRNDGFGIGLYSRIPFTKIEVKSFSEAGVPSIVAEFTWEGQQVSFITTHPVPPVSFKHLKWRNEQLANIALLKPNLAKNIILIGDLNTTSWTYPFQNILRNLELRDSRHGFGLQTTWPSPLPYVGITLDHCLISKNITVLKRTVGPDVGSDHLPVFIKIAL